MDYNFEEYDYKIPRICYIDTEEKLQECIKEKYNIIRKYKNKDRWEIYRHSKKKWVIDNQNNFIGEI